VSKATFTKKKKEEEEAIPEKKLKSLKSL